METPSFGGTLELLDRLAPEAPAPTTLAPETLAPERPDSSPGRRPWPRPAAPPGSVERGGADSMPPARRMEGAA